MYVYHSQHVPPVGKASPRVYLPYMWSILSSMMHIYTQFRRWHIQLVEPPHANLFEVISLTHVFRLFQHFRTNMLQCHIMSIPLSLVTWDSSVQQKASCRCSPLIFPLTITPHINRSSVLSSVRVVAISVVSLSADGNVKVMQWLGDATGRGCLGQQRLRMRRASVTSRFISLTVRQKKYVRQHIR